MTPPRRASGLLEPCHAPEWRWPAFSELKVNSRHPVMAVVTHLLSEMQLSRRTVIQILGSIPLFGWLDPVRSVANCDTAVHYRSKGDGRSLYKLLRDDIRNGIHHSDLERILGPLKVFGPVDHDYTVSAAPGYPDFPGIDLGEGHYYIEYPMSYCSVHLELKKGQLFNHDPTDYNEYPDGFLLREDGTIDAITRPLDEGPMKNPPPTYNADFDA